MKTLYAKQDGTWPTMLRLIQTAVDWQANLVVLVGTEGLDELAPRLHDRWAEYQIPMRVVGPVNEAALQNLPFEGSTDLDPHIEEMLDISGAVMDNPVLREFRPVPISQIV